MTFTELDPNVQSAIISASTTIFVLLLGGIGKWIYDRTSFSHKLKYEYTFQQKKRIKEEISKTKTPLLQSAEELNYRLWNLIDHLDEDWLNRKADEWKDPKHHYIRSFVYRWLRLMHWVLLAEKSVYKLDSTLSSKRDQLYLKYIKVLKHCFCDRLLISDLNYGSKNTDNHFYADELAKFVEYVDENGDVISYNEFEDKINEDLSDIEKVFTFFSNTRNLADNRSMNMLRCLHLILMSFLNEFGHQYQKTKLGKIKELLKSTYRDIIIKVGFMKFLKRNKIHSQMKWITKKMQNKSSEPTCTTPVD